MGWVTEQLGAGAILFPGFGFRDHARAAIQLLSGDIHQQRLYTHLGWRKHDGAWCYLHAGGATGAVSGVAVQPPETLARFRLPDPPEGPELREAIMASLRLTGLAPDPVTVPVHAATVRSVLGPADFSLHLAGPTGAGKTELAALAQQHFGAGLDARHLPASWTSTPNALEGLAFAAKNALLVIDDFSPGGSHTDIQRTHQTADRVLRAQGNHSGRGRMSPDATLKPIKPPRGLILSTGEDLPRGQSLQARMLTVELDLDTLDWQKLTAGQTDAASGLYAQAIDGYLRWLAPQNTQIAAQLPIEVARLRSAAAQSGTHRRTPLIVAELAAAAGYFLNYAQQAGAIIQTQADELWERTWQALGQAAAAQHRHHTAADPARRFLELLTAAIASGRAHLTTADGQQPANPGAWGWHQKPGSREWQPQGDKIGWLTENGLYLEPDAAHAAAQKLARDSGETIPTGRQTLHKRLHEHGLLASTDHESRGRLTVRRTLQGKRRTVLHLHPDTLTADSPEHPNQPNHTPPRPATPASTEETAGPDGTNGTVPDTDPGAKHKTGGEPPPATDAPSS